jgi:hypothetical protein
MTPAKIGRKIGKFPLLPAAKSTTEKQIRRFKDRQNFDHLDL